MGVVPTGAVRPCVAPLSLAALSFLILSSSTSSIRPDADMGTVDGRVAVVEPVPDVEASAGAPGLGPGPGLGTGTADTAGRGRSLVIAARRRDSASAVCDDKGG